MAITIKAYLRKKYSTDTHGTLYLRVTLERSHTYFNLGHSLPSSSFKYDTGTIIKHPLKNELNNLLILKKAELLKKILHWELSGQKVTPAMIGGLKDEAVEKTRFIDLVNQYIEVKGLGYQRTRHFKVTMNFWARYKMPECIEDCKVEDILSFKKALPAETMHNSIVSHMVRIKSIFAYAVKKKLIPENPVEDIKIGQWEAKTEYLTMAELDLFQEKSILFTEAEMKIYYMFLFQCYTGLRYGDVTSLKASNFQTIDDTTYMDIVANKTNVQERHPILPMAAKLLSHVIGTYYSNQYYNRTLKSIATKAGIQKEVTSHLARHTFATIALNKGMKIEVVQSLLGHKDIKTTQIYARLMDSTKLSELAKWEQ